MEFLVIEMGGSHYSQSPDSSEGLGPRELHSRAAPTPFAYRTILAASDTLLGLMRVIVVADTGLPT